MLLLNGLMYIFGSKVTMKYPSSILIGERALRDPSIASPARDSVEDADEIIHGAKTTSSVFAKSISKDGGRLHLPRVARWPRARPRDRRIFCPASPPAAGVRAPTPPDVRIVQDAPTSATKASVSKIGEEQRLPAQTRARRGGGVHHDRQRLHRTGRQGAADGVRRRADRLIELQMEGSIGWRRPPGRRSQRQGSHRGWSIGERVHRGGQGADRSRPET